MITYDQFKIIGGAMFFGGLLLLLAGLLMMRREATMGGALCAASGLGTLFWNGVGWYVNN